MTATTNSAEASEALSQLAEDIELQSADFLWIDFYKSADVNARIKPNSKLARLLERARDELPSAGFRWIEPPAYFRKVIEMTRSQVMRAGTDADRRAVVSSLLGDSDPPFLRQLQVH